MKPIKLWVRESDREKLKLCGKIFRTISIAESRSLFIIIEIIEEDSIAVCVSERIECAFSERSE